MTFAWGRRNLRLFDHRYNGTITNERAVEIPIAREWVAVHAREGYGLELGNVLMHYDISTGGQRRVVDKYEDHAAVRNVDVFEIDERYDWIVSVSTIEHVRQGDDGDNPYASIAALVFLEGLLTERGRMLVTVGLGQNPTLDRYLLNHPRNVQTQWLYARERSADLADNVWELTDASTLQYEPRPYGPTHGANALWVGEWW